MSKMKVEKSVNVTILELKRATKAGLQACGIIVQGQAVRRAPADTGRLRASIAWAADGEQTVHSKSYSSKKDSGTVTYNVTAPSNTLRVGSNLDYAAKQHEDLSLDHTKTGPSGELVTIGEAKFIEKAFMENKQRLIDTINAAYEGKW